MGLSGGYPLEVNAFPRLGSDEVLVAGPAKGALDAAVPAGRPRRARRSPSPYGGEVGATWV